MIDARYYTQEFLAEFLELYKSLPCLWKKKSKEYNNKTLKAAGYKKMVEKLKEVNPNASRDAVVKKINSMRVSRRKEWTKVQKSIRSGTEIYKPTLWFYDLLSFIEESDAPDNHTSDTLLDPISLPEPQVKTEESEIRLSCEDNVSESHSHTSQYTFEYQEVDSDFPGTSLTSSPFLDSRRPSKRKLTQSSYGDSAEENDRFDIFGKSVAMKMRDLPTQQRLVAEKIINDTLFKAEMGILRLSDAMDLPQKSK